MIKYVAYYRVSTTKQGQSGLGLEAQKTAVRQFVKCDGPAGEPDLQTKSAFGSASGPCIVKEFVEVESGKLNNRPQLQAAIDYAKTKKVTLVIAKLDRLSRNAGFIFALKDSGVNFVCADMPDANTLTIGIFATLAQHERELISSRTKAALAAKKKQGTKLGNLDNLTQSGRSKGVEAIKEKAKLNENNKRANNYVKMLRSQVNEAGSKPTWQHIADQLNSEGYRTAKGKYFQPMQVYRIFNTLNK